MFSSSAMVGAIIGLILLMAVTMCDEKIAPPAKARKATAMTKNRGGGDAPSPFGFVWGDPVQGEEPIQSTSTTISSPTAKQSPSLEKRAFNDNVDDKKGTEEKRVDDREERHPPNGIFPHRYRSESQSRHEHKHHHHHPHHHDKKRRGSSSHHQHKCGCQKKHEHHECHKGCKVESLKRCTMELSGLTLIKTSVPYCQAQEACRTFGMYLAEIDIANWVDATSVAFQCNGPFTSSWIRSWNGDLYLSNESAGGSGTVPIGNNTAKACLTLDTGNSLPGGAVTVPASCEITYPVLCQRQPNKDALEPQQEEKKEQHCGCQCDHCRHSTNEHGYKPHHHNHHRRRRTSSDEQSTSSDEELVPRRNTSLIGSEHEHHHRPDKAIKQDGSNDDDSTEDEEEEDSGKEPEDDDSNSVEDKKGIAKVTGPKETTVVKGKSDEKKKQPVTLQAKQITAQKQKTDFGAQAIAPLAKRGFEEDLHQHGRKGKRDWQRINQGLVEYKQKNKDQGRKHPHGPVAMGTVAKSNKRLIAVNQGLVQPDEEKAKMIVIPQF